MADAVFKVNDSKRSTRIYWLLLSLNI